MSLSPLPGGTWVPYLPQFSLIADNDFDLGPSDIAVANIIQIPKTGTLDRFEFDLRAFTQCTNGLRVSFQDLNSSGEPDGTEDQFRVVSVSATGWVTPGLITSDGTDTGTKRSVTQGDLVACVIGFESLDAGDFVGVRHGGGPSLLLNSPPFARRDNGTNWVYGTICFHMALKYSDGTYAPMQAWQIQPVSGAATDVAYASNSTPDERGLYFSFPKPVAIDGIGFLGDVNGNTDLVLYDTNGTSVLASKSIVSGHGESSPGGFAYGLFEPVELTANGTYRAVVKPTTTSTVVLGEFDVESASHMAGTFGGADWHLTTRTDAGSWSQTTTTKPMIFLHLAEIAGGGQTAHCAWS